MSQSLSHYLTHKLIDWLIALCVVWLLLWFFLTQPVIAHKSKSITAGVDVQELKRHVELLTKGYAPRTINFDNLNNAADYIYREFSRFGVPKYQTINTLTKQYHNVFLQLGPDTEEWYVIGAHYDAADDSIDTEGNASGVATLIELARQLAMNNDKLKIGIILIAYPLSLNQSDNIVNTGSYFHANSLRKNNKKVRLMISLDSVGQTYSQEDANEHPYHIMDLLYPPQNEHVYLVGRLTDFKAIRELQKGFNGVLSLSLYSHNLLESFNKTASTDHRNYWKQGYPAVLISDAVENATTGEIKSKVEPKNRLNYKKMAMLITSLYQVLIQTSAKESDKTRLAQRAKNTQAEFYY